MQLHTTSGCQHVSTYRFLRPRGLHIGLGICTGVPCSAAGARQVSSTVAYARLPHMDEELEHMQWQLDKRTHDGASGANSSTHARHAARKRKLVFHDRHSKQTQHTHHPEDHRRQRRQHQTSTASSSDGSDGSDSSGVFNSISANAGSATEASLGNGAAAGQQEVGDTAAAAAQREEQFFCLQLDHTGAAADLQKAQERLAKHIQQDGGCCISAPVSQASMLTHLLLLLQHKQLHKKSDHWGSDTLLLLQPLGCELLPDAASETAAGLAATGLSDAPSTHPAAAGDRGRRSLVQSASGLQAVSCACTVAELKLFASFMPLHTLLSVEHGSTAGHVCVPDSTAASTAASSAASTAASSSASQQSWSAADSSMEEPASTPSSGGRPHLGSRVGHRLNRSSGELLKAASSSGSSAVAALLLDAAEQGRLRSIHVGPHAEPAGTAASVAAAVASGEVLGLHVKDHPAAHAVAYSALELASSALHAPTQAQPLGFGVLLVQGMGHEHVHARAHGHAHGSAGGVDGAHAGGSDSAAADAVFHPQQHHSRVQGDASMDVGGFGAAYYGLGGLGDRSGQQQQGLLHRHEQEAWLCVVPFHLGS